MAVPVISIVGRSEAGKTTLIEKLIPELCKRGYRVGSIKHAQEIDAVEVKDGERHLLAGSVITAVAVSGRIVVTKRSESPEIEEVVRLLGNDIDIIICEGYKQSDTPKLEVHRKDHGALLDGLKRLVAIVTDEPLDNKIRQFALNDINGIADLLEKGYIIPQGNGLDMYINGRKIILTSFPRQIINDVVLAMADSLKDVDPIRTLEIVIRKSQADRKNGGSGL